MIRNLRISAVVPCFNEEGGIRQVILRMPVRVDEIVVADNRSTDRTAEVARSMGARVIPVETRGYGAALAGGFAAATGDVIVSLDGDATYPPEEIPRLVGAAGRSPMGLPLGVPVSARRTFGDEWHQPARELGPDPGDARALLALDPRQPVGHVGVSQVDPPPAQADLARDGVQRGNQDRSDPNGPALRRSAHSLRRAGRHGEAPEVAG